MRISFKALINQHGINQSVKQFSDNQSISGMETFQIYKDKNITFTFTYLLRMELTGFSR